MIEQRTRPHRNRRRWSSRRGRQARRGVLLLIVLSLLVLFVLLGLTFIVSAGQFKRISAADARTGQTGNLPDKLTDAALDQVLRGSLNPQSALQFNSLLEDMYGNGASRGRVGSGNSAVTSVSGGQFHRLQVVQANGSNIVEPSYTYSGRLITMISGAAKGLTGRVIEHLRNPVTGVTEFLVDGFPFVGTTPSVRPNDEFVLNGQPFDGLGAGFNSAGIQEDGSIAGTVFQNIPVALRPNYQSLRELPRLLLVPSGGMDESWDAVDYQNLFLAKIPANPALYNLSTLATRKETLSQRITPSFHRPELIDYWLKSNHYNGLVPADQLTFRRSLVMRPNQADHPAFTGSNPGFDPIYGPWDVDNDADGVADSIWTDFGLAPVQGPDGRMYKPLVAALIVDMDGRLNLNVHGNTSLVVPKESGQEEYNGPVKLNGSLPAARRLSTDPTGLTELPFGYPRGKGFGPAEVNLAPLFPGPLPTYSPYSYLGLLETRYLPTQGAEVDMKSQRAEAGEPNNIDTFNVNRLGYAHARWQALPYARGFGLVYLDGDGYPVWWGDDALGLDDPYSAEPLAMQRGKDQLFAAADLEWILRRQDVDQGRLSSRLGQISGLSLQAQDINQVRNLVTTHSVSVPTLPPVPESGGKSLVNHVRERLTQGISSKYSLPPEQLELRVTDEMRNMLPPEVLRGEKMDLNRLFRVYATVSPQMPVPSDPSLFQPVFERELPTGPEYAGLQHVNPLVQNLKREQYAKGLFARHLYCLAMAVLPKNAVYPSTAGGSDSAIKQQLTARRIAQWAVNVVDYRDEDGTCTPFEYDVNPWDGWDVNGVFYEATEVLGNGNNELPANDPMRGVVWGMEYPELLLTEAFAFHDRMVGNEDVGGKREAAPPDEDEDMDQLSPPESALFLELYSPRPNRRTTLPQPFNGPEALYNTSGASTLLNLGKFQSRPDGPTPVWRIVVSDRQQDSPVNQLIDPSTGEAVPDADLAIIEPNLTRPDVRYVWLSDMTQVIDPARHEWGRTYHVDSTHNAPLLAPGAYAVIGPQLKTSIGVDPSLRHQDYPKRFAPSKQIIELAQDGVRYYQPGTNPGDPEEQVSFRRSLTLITRSHADFDGNGEMHGVSVSAPLPKDYASQYPLFGPLPAEPKDQPYDLNGPLGADPTLTSTHTNNNFKTAFLQRLANPALPWNPEPGDARYLSNLAVNPYVTVDWIAVPISVFNSGLSESDADSIMVTTGDIDPQDPNFKPSFDFQALLQIGSRERVGRNDLSDRATEPFVPLSDPSILLRDFWGFDAPSRSQYISRIDPTTEEPNGSDIPGTVLRPDLLAGHSLGGLNRLFTVTSDGTRLQPNQLAPRPWLAWNNRPYGSPLEILNVPKSSAAQFSAEFRMMSRANIGDPGPMNPFVPLPDTQPPKTFQAPFGHTMNVYQPQFPLIRLLDYIDVPSPFIDSEKWYNSSLFGSQAPDGMKSPFNHRSNFREPGKININTIYDSRVWSAIGGDRYAPWQQVEMSMNGYPRIYPNDQARYDIARPAERLNPFRAPYSASLMPTTEPMKEPTEITTVIGSNFATSTDWLKRQETHATFLRPHDIFNAEPLFSQKYTSTNGQLGPYAGLDAAHSVSPELYKNANPVPPHSYLLGMHDNPARNSYFYHQGLQKLGSILTTQSNVFAVWITVGYFEIEPNYPTASDGTVDYTKPYAIDTMHPDGYRYGTEWGVDSGQVKRNRAFYILDRSIPVAFERGQNHNIDKAILLRRYLE